MRTLNANPDTEPKAITNDALAQVQALWKDWAQPAIDRQLAKWGIIGGEYSVDTPDGQTIPVFKNPDGSLYTIGANKEVIQLSSFSIGAIPKPVSYGVAAFAVLTFLIFLKRK